MSATRPRPVMLCVLDGWGHREAAENNAVKAAETPTFDRLWREAPHALLRTSAGDVGLPEGQMGNSEVGHQNLGAGRVVLQDLPRIDQAVADGSLAKNAALTNFIDTLRQSGGSAHVVGLLSPGGVHAHDGHMLALARILADAGLEVLVHALLDGRDTPPKSAAGYVAAFEGALRDLLQVRIATVSGRYYAMDRDTRWERVVRAYDAVVSATGERAVDGGGAIANAYAADLSDEFVLPTAIGNYAGMQDGDGLLMANFRADRARQILAALLDPAFDGFKRARRVEFAARLGMVSYSEALDSFIGCLFPSSALHGTLPEVVAEAGLRQLRIAETEKYAHVTFFLNGGSERTVAGEERILVPSPKVATYDLLPEMSANEVTDRLVAAIAEARFDLIVVNYANADMVGHTGDMAAAVKAVEAVDGCLGRLERALVETGGQMLVTADHGNVEMMTDPESGQPHTAHTTNPVPVLLVNAAPDARLVDGRLADVAPTLLELLDLARPAEMTGRSLLRSAKAAHADGESRASA